MEPSAALSMSDAKRNLTCGNGKLVAAGLVWA
jgi:hypothetical protein